MTFKSKAQHDHFKNLVNKEGSGISKEMFDNWSKDTDFDSLPERIGKPKTNKEKKGPHVPKNSRAVYHKRKD